MFNDPSGEFFFLAPVIGWLVANAAVIGTGALIGTLISVGMYTLQATLNNNWSLGGFGKAILMGAVTGAISAGAGQIFSAAGFWATVGNGAIAGGASGGVTALINGDNFLKGLARGAVIGGAVAGLTYTINYYVKGYNKARYKTASSDISGDAPTYDAGISHDTMQDNVGTMRSDNFTKSEIGEFEVGKDTVGYGGVDGYIYPGDGSKVYAYTTLKNFWTGKSDIVYAPIAAQNKDLLAATMVHETGHAYSQKLGLFDIQLKTDTSEHLAMAKLEHVYADRNLISKLQRSYNTFYTRPSIIDKMYNQLNQISRSVVDNTYNKLMPIFNRFMFYGK